MAANFDLYLRLRLLFLLHCIHYPMARLFMPFFVECLPWIPLPGRAITRPRLVVCGHSSNIHDTLFVRRVLHELLVIVSLDLQVRTLTYV